MDADNRAAWARNRPFYRALGKRITELRTAQELTQAELARTLHVSQQALFAYELGDRRVPVWLLPALVRTFRVSVEALIGIAPLRPVQPARVSPAQQRHVEQLRRLENRDRLAVMRITEALRASTPADQSLTADECTVVLRGLQAVLNNARSNDEFAIAQRLANSLAKGKGGLLIV